MSEKLYVVGIVGVPGQYGGFETLVEYLLDARDLKKKKVYVFCEKNVGKDRPSSYKGANLIYLPLKANGGQSILYDALGMLIGAFKGTHVLILGTSATIFLPIFRVFFPRVRFVVNMAGLEWSRSKWGWVARKILLLNEWAAAKFSHKLIADNEGLLDYVRERYEVEGEYIPYGGDQYLDLVAEDKVFEEWDIPRSGYDFAIARAQSDNNLDLILDAYADLGVPLVYVSNWDSSEYGKELKSKYSSCKNIHMIGPVYSPEKVAALHKGAGMYVHGHSSGGTNPTLVEAMWSGLPILAFDVSFNRYTTESSAAYFSSKDELVELRRRVAGSEFERSGQRHAETARKRYSWDSVCKRYLEVIKG